MVALENISMGTIIVVGKDGRLLLAFVYLEWPHFHLLSLIFPLYWNLIVVLLATFVLCW